MWLVLSGNTLWGRFARAKYGRGNQFLRNWAKSPLWDSIVSHEQCLRAIGHWLVGRGHINFWADNWLGEILQGPLPCDIKLKVREALPMIDQLQHLIPTHLEEKIKEICINNQQADQLKFSITKNGEFSSKKYMEWLRPSGPKRAWVAIIWHSFLHPKIVTFFWKLLRQALPVDTRIISKGIQIVSKCRCCKIAAIESITHLFLQWETAAEVWRCFGNMFRLPSTFSSVEHALNIWLPKVGALSQFDLCRAGITSFCLWEL